MAVFRFVFEPAVRLLVKVPAHVVHDDPPGAHRPKRAILFVGLGEPGLLGHVGKGPVAIIVVQSVAMDSRYKDVLMAVIVIVADRNTNVVARPREAGSFGHIGEGSVAVVSKQAVGISGRVLL